MEVYAGPRSDRCCRSNRPATVAAGSSPCGSATRAEVLLRVWRAQVGRVPLYLLDTDFEPNDPIDRDLTRRLYGGDRDLRLRQEILLGIGGLRVAAGAWPAAGDLPPERRPRRLPGARADPRADARAATDLRRGPPGRVAGHGLHHPHPGPGRQRRLPRRACSTTTSGTTTATWASRGPSSWARVGRTPHDEGEPFSMTILALAALRCQQRGQQAPRRRSAPDVAPDLAGPAAGSGRRSARSPTASTCPPGSRPRWLPWSGKAETATRRDDGRSSCGGATSCCERRLIDFARRRLARPARAAWGGPGRAGPGRRSVLDPNALTIGFARRFAGYKRATLLLQRPRATGPAGQPARQLGPVHLRRQGPPARRRRQGADPRADQSWRREPSCGRGWCSWRTTT